MRYFLICDDTGTLIYCDHPDGMMMGLIFHGLDKFLTERDEHFSQKFKSMCCGDVLFVAQKVCPAVSVCVWLCPPLHFGGRNPIYMGSRRPEGCVPIGEVALLEERHRRWLLTLLRCMQYKNLSFLVVSDQGESEMYLRTLLRQMYQLLPSQTAILRL